VPVVSAGIGLGGVAAHAAGGGRAERPLDVPPGFVVERVAGAPLVDRPTLACFDDRGRLYVAQSAGANPPGGEPAKDPPHRIVVLEDTDGDGRFDRSAVFADKLVRPQGLLWHDGAVFVASPPSLWRLRDTDGDAVADERKELITGFARTGASDDVRGACLGPDGYVYTCAGAFPHDLKDVNGKPLHKGRSPLLVRCRPDGSNAEVVGGLQGNPAEVAWSAPGDAFASGALYGGGEGMRDAIVHSVEGGDYPVLGFTADQHEMKRTGGLLPPLVHAGAVAPAGMACYRSFTLGRAFTGNLVCAYSDARTVQRHVLEPDGSTFRARTEDLLTSPDPDFHPTDVLEDADGSLLVVDTGGRSRAGGAETGAAGGEAAGGIFRVRRDGAPRIADARGLKQRWDKADPEELARRLEDLRLPVVDRATRELARRGADGVAALSSALGKSSSVPTRLNAVWVLTRIDGPEARAAVRYALVDRDAGVRQAAAYSAGLHRDAGAAALLIDLLRVDQPAVRREAAAALGRIGRTKAAEADGAAAAPPPAPPGQPPQAVAASGPQAAPDAAPGTTPAPSTPTPAPAAAAKPAATTAPAAGPTTGPTTRPAAATAPTAGPATAPTTPPAGGAAGAGAPAAPPAPPLPPSPAVPALLDALRSGPDRFLEHAVIYALIRIADRESTLKGLQDPDPAVRRAAKLSLDAMGDDAGNPKSPAT
jgi:putative membrane-bound dehydrogenase-like protein